MSNLDASLEYLRTGWPVFPVCPRAKTPLVPWKPYQDRLPTEKEVRQWWTKCPEANIGMSTGHLSGLVVIDCDSEDAAKQVEESYPDAKGTLQAQTGRGVHFYFRYEENIRNGAGVLPGVDVRGEGGFVVLPPSLHSNGNTYRWLNKNKPITLPDKLKELLTSRAKDSEQPKTLSPANGDRIPEGKRNATLTSMAGTMRRRGMGEKAIRAALRVENSTKCDPPLPEGEVEQIAKGVAQYEAKADGNGSNPWAKRGQIFG